MISSRFAICAAAAAVALSLSACSTVDLDKDKAGSITDGTSVEEALSSKTGPLANREVHFDFDSYTVSPDQMPVVTNHAQFLAAHKNLNVRLEGNTDEGYISLGTGIGGIKTITPVADVVEQLTA